MRVWPVTVACVTLAACTTPRDRESDSSLDSGLPDTAGDSTVDGPEEPLYEPPECTNGEDCDDRNPCTHDSCVEGSCVNEPFTGQAFTEPDVQVTDHEFYVQSVNTSWTGAAIGIAWSDGRDGGCRDLGMISCNTEVFFNRLSGAAEVLGADMRLSDTETESSLSGLTWTGTEHLALWIEWDRSAINRPWIARIEPSGHEVGSEFGPDPVEHNAYSPNLVWTGSEVVVTWIGYTWGGSDPLELHLARFAPDGIEIADTVLVADSDLRYGGHYLEWTGSELAMTYDVRDPTLGRFTPDGTLIGEVDFRFNSTRDWINGLAWTGSELGVFFHGAVDPEDPCRDTRCNNLNIRRLAPDGTDIGEPVQITDNYMDMYLMDVLWTGSEWALSWYRETGWEYESWLTRLGPDGARVEEDMRLRAPSSVEWTGSTYMAAWSEHRDGRWNVFANVVGSCE